jgi:hypothetical protein
MEEQQDVLYSRISWKGRNEEREYSVIMEFNLNYGLALKIVLSLAVRPIGFMP